MYILLLSDTHDLQAEIASVSGDSRASLKHVVNLPEDNSIVVVERDGRDGKEAVVNVNLSEQDHNGIRLNRDGLYTYVDIEYDPSGNTLTLWRSDKNVTDALVPHTVQLKNDISIIDHIEYDKENEEIVIWYRNSAGELKNFRIPVSDIIEEWDVKDTFTVELKKERNVEQHKDILTAEVKICSAHTDNILVVHRNEGLYVSGSQIEENKNNIAKISGDVINEIARAEGAEQALNDKIDQEISDRIADVDDEETRAKNAEQALDTKIDQEIADRIADVDAEETRAKGAEADLQTEIEAVSADSLNSIKNIVCEDGSLYVNGYDKSNVTISVRIDPHHDDNTLVNHENDGLYVPANNDVTRALSGAIDDERDRAISAENALDDRIDQEIARATSAEAALSGAIIDERGRAISAENALDDRIEREIARATSAENVISNIIGTGFTDNPYENVTFRFNSLSGKLDTEIERSTTTDAFISGAVDTERSERINDSNFLSGSINTLDSKVNTLSGEVQTISGSSEDLRNDLDQEIADRQADVDAEEARAIERENQLESMIFGNVLSFVDTPSIDFTASGNIVSADVKIRDIDDNLIKNAGGGIYATAHLNYNAATNTIKLTTSVGEEEFQLSAGAIIDNIYFDENTGELVITYHNAEGVQTVRFSVSELFNPWIIDNPVSGSAIELHKETATTQGAPDKLSAKVLLTNLPDNAVQIINNGLYVSKADAEGAAELAKCAKNEVAVLEKVVIGHRIDQDCGSGYTYEPNGDSYYITTATSFNHADIILDQNLKNAKDSIERVSATSECAKNELKVFETAVLGTQIIEECGQGYSYRPNPYATYISGATSFTDADFKLDQAIKGAKDDISTLSGKTECVDSKANKIYELLNGVGTSMPDCGSGTIYTPDLGSCVISAATSFMEADRMLGDQICEILEMWQSGMTCTSISNWIDDGANKRLEVDVRPSYGNSMSGMTNEDLYITNLTGKTIEHGVHEFTDTNALRIVCLQEGGGGVIPDVKSIQNGVYLSNVWNCGKYYQQSTEAAEMAEVSNDGYNVNYFTDEDSSSANYDYNNNVRQ